MPKFDMFIALDGPSLDGIKRGFAGLARLRCSIKDGKLAHEEPKVIFDRAVACGHATQVNKEGNIGFLGNTSNQLLLYDPKTMEELDTHSTLQEYLPTPTDTQEGQTHAVWVSQKEYITVIGPYFYQIDVIRPDKPRLLGAHGVKLPHAIKLSPSGRWLCYGSMDSNDGWARQVGFFDLQTNKARIFSLKRTVWHIGVHPTKDIFYAPTQCVEPQPSVGDKKFNFEEWTIAYDTNYLHRFDIVDGEIREYHMAFPPALPHHLTSDVIVTDDHQIIYNCCASSTIAVVDFIRSRVRYIDERTGLLSWRYGAAARENLVDGLMRTNITDNWHNLIKALRATRFSKVDGSYGLAMSPNKQFLLSAHRGRNQVIIYKYPELEKVKIIKFPYFDEVCPDWAKFVGKKRGLGFHHATLSETSCRP